MTTPAFEPQTADERDILALYEDMLTAWNVRLTFFPCIMLDCW